MDLDALFSQWFPSEAKEEKIDEDEGKAGEEQLEGFTRTLSNTTTASERAAWEPKYDQDMKMYWINMKTKKITWTNPYATKRSGEDGEDGEGGEEEMDPLKTRWTEANDPKTGRMYYFHKDTKEVTWAKPEEYKMYEKAKKELEKQQDKAARKQRQKERIEKEEEKARLKSVSWIKRAFGAKPPTKEDLMKMAEIEQEKKTRPKDISMRFYREGMHHIKFKVDTLEVLTETGSRSEDMGGSSTGSNRRVYDEYEGEMKNYKFDGRGVFLHSTGERYEGEWQRGKQHGRGVKTWPDGNVYKGEYVEDRREGQGEMKYYDGTIYRGGWKNSLYHGQGEMIFKLDRTDPWAGSYQVSIGEDGAKEIAWAVKYTGEWAEGVKCGQGVLTFDDGSKYVGEFKADRYDGKGKMVWGNGDVYEGGWAEGKQEGEGKERLVELEEVYEGEFHGGDRNGKGKLTVKSGWSWTGQFKNGKRTGKGVHISPSGEKLVGEWWQHAAPRNEIPSNVADTVVSTYALHSENYADLFKAKRVGVGGGDGGALVVLDSMEGRKDKGKSNGNEEVMGSLNRFSTFFDAHKERYGFEKEEKEGEEEVVGGGGRDGKSRGGKMGRQLSRLVSFRSKK